MLYKPKGHHKVITYVNRAPTFSIEIHVRDMHALEERGRWNLHVLRVFIPILCPTIIRDNSWLQCWPEYGVLSFFLTATLSNVPLELFWSPSDSNWESETAR